MMTFEVGTSFGHGGHEDKYRVIAVQPDGIVAAPVSHAGDSVFFDREEMEDLYPV